MVVNKDKSRLTQRLDHSGCDISAHDRTGPRGQTFVQRVLSGLDRSLIAHPHNSFVCFRIAYKKLLSNEILDDEKGKPNGRSGSYR